MLLDDLIGPDLRAVFCGTALGAASRRRMAYYAGPGNAFWPTLHEVGLSPRVLAPEEYPDLLTLGLGLTDVCKTRSGSDLEIGRTAFDRPRLLALLERWRPRWIAFTSKNAARAGLGVRAVTIGERPELLGPSRVYVLPSPSGAARGHWDITPWRRFAELIA